MKEGTFSRNKTRSTGIPPGEERRCSSKVARGINRDVAISTRHCVVALSRKWGAFARRLPLPPPPPPAVESLPSRGFPSDRVSVQFQLSEVNRDVYEISNYCRIAVSREIFRRAGLTSSIKLGWSIKLSSVLSALLLRFSFSAYLNLRISPARILVFSSASSRVSPFDARR